MNDVIVQPYYNGHCPPLTPGTRVAMPIITPLIMFLIAFFISCLLAVIIQNKHKTFEVKLLIGFTPDNEEMFG